MDQALIERVETRAFADLHAAAPEPFAERVRLRCGTVGGGLCMALGAAPSERTFNRVQGLGIDEDATDAVLDEVVEFYGDHPYIVSVPPQARPSDLPGRLAARGYQPAYAWVKFARAPSPPPPAATDLVIEAVGPQGAAQFASAVTGGFGMPPVLETWLTGLPGRPGWTCYVAYAPDGVPAGAAAMFIDDGAAWLGMASVLPRFRGRHGQAALLARRLADAAAAGTEVAVTETGALDPARPGYSHRNILAAGFEAVYERPNLRR